MNRTYIIIAAAAVALYALFQSKSAAASTVFTGSKAQAQPLSTAGGIAGLESGIASLFGSVAGGVAGSPSSSAPTGSQAQAPQLGTFATPMFTYGAANDTEANEEAAANQAYVAAVNTTSAVVPQQGQAVLGSSLEPPTITGISTAPDFSFLTGSDSSDLLSGISSSDLDMLSAGSTANSLDSYSLL